MKRQQGNSQVEPLSKKIRFTRSNVGNVVPESRDPDKPWPEYFHSLFKIYKAVNTVLAFISSKKQLAVSFSVVRASVEGLLKHTLELSSVAELKALLPNLIKFSFIPKNDLRMNDNPEKISAKDDSAVPLFSNCDRSNRTDNEGYVLVLEFVDNLHGKKSSNSGFPYATPPTLSPAAVKKLVEKRNGLFKQAVDELLLATVSPDDPVELLQNAGRDHIPLEPTSSKEVKNVLVIPESTERATIKDIIEEIRQQIWYKDQIIHRETLAAKDAQIGVLDQPLSNVITQALLESRQIVSLYIHQVAAIKAVQNRQNVIVSTNTASGKSIIYQIPLLTFLGERSSTTAMFVYPTKALAQDQKSALEQLLFCCPSLSHVNVATYDGDTAKEDRQKIRETSSVIFTNFDTIHASILPHEGLWRTFLKNLQILAVDELHYYSGLFGSHVALIIRRLRRVCAAVGNRSIQFISCTATISNPRLHMQAIFGLVPSDVEVVSQNGAPSGVKEFLVWNPALVDPMAPALGRHSSLSEATQLMRFLMKHGVRVILFCKIRKICELAMKNIRTELSNEGRYDILERVKPYRGGYSEEDRRGIEREAFSGRLLGIVATNALELGIDIGVLDAVVMVGFPMKIASFRQQAGRAGRRSRDSLTVFIADPFPVDQYYVNHPTELFDKVPDDLSVDLESKVVLEAHLQCAGQELPLSREDESYFGPLMHEICAARLWKDKDGWYHTHPNFLPYPSRHVSIRGVQEEKYTLVEIEKEGKSEPGARVLEEVELSRATFEVYEGGVFLHQGVTFIVKEVNHDTRLAKVIRTNVNYTTSPRDFTNVDAIQTHRIREIKNSKVYYGKVNVNIKVFGFFKIRKQAVLDAVDLNTPPYDCNTTGFWIDVPQVILELMRYKNINPAEAIHAAEHAFLNQFSMAQDLRTECKAAKKEYKIVESQRKRPARLIFYDTIGGSGGVAAKAFDCVVDIFKQALNAIDNCDCEEGCLHCVQSSMCKEANQVSSKPGAKVIVMGILGLEIDVDKIPTQSQLYPLPETIIEAQSVRVVDNVEVNK